MGPDGRNDNLNLPNTLSLIRILAAPVLIVLLLSPGEVLSFVAAGIFALGCITDWLDGYFARKRGLVTSMGKFLDPLADKLLINTAFIMLIPLGRVPAWVVALIVALVALILHYPFFGVDFRALGVVFLVIAFVLTMWSGADYFLKFFRSAGF